MRYFWAEDFNEDAETGDKLEEKLRIFFGLSSNNTINKKNLKTMIEYLENKRNFRKIDAFLLDIRFPVNEVEKDKSKNEIYEKFFREFITEKMYNDNIDDAPGLLLYLLLVFRYHVPLNKIVFISAHVSNNSLLNYINSLKDLLYKKQYSCWDEKDKNKYTSHANHLIETLLKEGVYTKEEDYKWLSSSNQNIDDVINKLNKLVSDHSEYFLNSDSGDGALSKYKELTKQFRKMGLTMPLAFEKPQFNDIEIDKKYSFIAWEKDSNLIPYNAIREAIQEMSGILIDCMKKNKNIYSGFVSILTCDSKEISVYDDLFFTNYLENIIDLLPLELVTDEDLLSTIVVKEIASIWENVALPKYRTELNFKKKYGIKEGKKFYHYDPIFYAYHSTMKIVRNWSGHQGIKNIVIKDMGWIFIISMRGIFDIDELKDKKYQYIEYEKQILSFFRDINKVEIDLETSKVYFTNLNNATMKNTGTSDDIYERISGLGNASSKIRLDVSMDEIYMLFYHLYVKVQSIMNNPEYSDYLSEALYIYEEIKNRTWINWKDRYNKRFRDYFVI